MHEVIPASVVREGQVPADVMPLLGDSRILFEITNDAYVLSHSLLGLVPVVDLAVTHAQCQPCLPDVWYTFSNITLCREPTPPGGSITYSVVGDNSNTDVSA